jgi:hypothetical protein
MPILLIGRVYNQVGTKPIVLLNSLLAVTQRQMLISLNLAAAAAGSDILQLKLRGNSKVFIQKKDRITSLGNRLDFSRTVASACIFLELIVCVVLKYVV